MSKHSRKLIVGLIIFVACRQVADQNWVADVNGRQVVLATLEERIENRLEEQEGLEREDVLNQELNRLVTELVVLTRAEQLGIEIADEQVDARITRVHGEKFDASDPDFREMVRNEMRLERTSLVDLAGRIHVSESVLVLYFEENRDRFRRPEQIRVRQIVVEDRAKAKHLATELEQGGDFATLAQEHSIAPEAKLGGLLPAFASGEMPEVFEIAFDSKVGEHSDVVESGYGFHIFRVESRSPPKEPDFEEVRDDILLEVEQKQLAELRRDWFRNLRRVSNIRINEPLLETLR